MTTKTPEEEVDDIVDDLVEEKRRKIAENKEELVETIVSKVDTFREMNVVFSEVRRKLDGDLK